MTQHRPSSHRVRTAVCVVISMMAVACGTRGGHGATDAAGAGPLTTITGAGCTFDQPYLAQAFATYGPRNGVAITYDSIGSGGGIQQFTANKVDFGASDVPINAAESAAANKTGGAVVQIAIDLGAVVIAYHWPFSRSIAWIPVAPPISRRTI
jgi:phosphate transport system substrate-binding protein